MGYSVGSFSRTISSLCMGRLDTTAVSRTRKCFLADACLLSFALFLQFVRCTDGVVMFSRGFHFVVCPFGLLNPRPFSDVYDSFSVV